MTGRGLFDPAYEKDSCGVGMIVNIDGSKDHRVVELALETLENMEHRGAENADGRTGDGAGITVQIPHDFFGGLDMKLPEPGSYGTGIVFLPREEEDAMICRGIIRGECRKMGLDLIAEREVPVDRSVPGPLASETEPEMMQVFVSGRGTGDLERQLYRLSKGVGNRIDSMGIRDFYICSLSSKYIVYKGMLTPAQLRNYYKDLSDPDFRSAIAMVHSRFSTNTMPKWKLAQPFRMLCHNGEINTIKGNRAWMKARESVSSSDVFEDTDALYPVIQEGMSDSASLDNVFEFLTMSGRSMTNSLSILVPESWNNRNPIPDSLKAYYEYHSIFMEPWDGPAAILFTDGVCAGGMLDRNGLRPSRYAVTKEGMFILASEAGVIQIPDADLAEAGRLMPGKMILVDTSQGRMIYDGEIKEELASSYPYRDWLEKNRLELDEVSSGRKVVRSVDDIGTKLRIFGYTEDDLTNIIIPMAENGEEPTGSMAADIPLAVLSDKPQRLFNYFRQSFAQVTNPPMDPIREELVMSITGYIGHKDQNILDPVPRHCNVVKIRRPIITNRELDLLKNLRYRGFDTAVIPIVFDVSGGRDGFAWTLEGICRDAEEAVDRGASYIILSDRTADRDHAAIPSLLAVSAVHQHLIAKNKRSKTGIIAESGEPREVMHFALLLGYGANAVNPYLAYAAVDDRVRENGMKMDAEAAERNYIRASEKGIMKIMSKMGISTIRSYVGSGLFEAIGLGREFTQRYFGETVSSIGGIGIGEIADDILCVHREAFTDGKMKNEGFYGYVKDREEHSWSPKAVKLLNKAARENDADAYRQFAYTVDNGRLFIRHLTDIERGTPVQIGEVESAASIMRRFVGEGISFGAISKEAHETFVEAMNRLGGQSNTGEGGEDPARFSRLPDGRDVRARVKQIASGRFGVTVEYLVNADEIQIKIAQGAKPGEGGQLLGPKVDEEIAATRNTIPGITLISPPPHHDIYSIEDLKQLIFDLKCVNPKARVSVKLASESGVGTVAAGVVKAGADVILISGSDGGTGASPLSSIRYAGMPWETGLAETQQTLMANGLRGRVRLQTDGQMKTGKDVITAALLGAEEYGFATAPMVAMGCIMCRRCQSNVCPVGIATQDPERRKKFNASPEHVMNYLVFVAEEVRSYLAEMGFRSLDDIIGRSDLLKVKDTDDARAGTVDLSDVLYSSEGTRKFREGQPDNTGGIVDRRLIRDAKIAIEMGHKVSLDHKISNIDRSTGSMLSGEIVRRGNDLAEDTITITFKGTAGQSFGGFLTKGVTLILKGQANDYVGKGLSGGKIAICRDGPEPKINVIAGNTALYGATSGEAYIAGKVGERFCVRNSGAVAVAEGAGDHCCEYMTGGRAVILGKVGRNFAAGMSAGIAYVLNDGGDFDRHCNMDMVELSPVDSEEDRAELRRILEDHVRYTGSRKANDILGDWDRNLQRFLKVMPIGYKERLEHTSSS